MEEEKNCAFQRLCGAKGLRQELVHVLPRTPEARSELIHARSQRQLEARILSALYSEFLLLRLPSRLLAFVPPPTEFPPFPSPNHAPPAFRMTPALDNSKDPRPSLTFQLVFLPTDKGPLKNVNQTPSLSVSQCPGGFRRWPPNPGTVAACLSHLGSHLLPLPLHSSSLRGVLSVS